MAESAATSTVLWLGKLLLAEITYLGEVRDEVETLQTNLKMLAAFVADASKNPCTGDLVRTALDESRNLAYDCEDVIETYMVQVVRHGYEQYKGCQLGFALRWACLLRKGVPLHNIHSEIDGLNKRIDTLRSNLGSYGVPLRIDNSNDQQQIPPLVYPHEKEERVVVGLESQLKELVGRLIDPADHKVILLCGMGGVGKSTLATELYRHQTLKEDGHFQAFAWAAASRKLQPNQVLQTIMHLLVPENDVERRKKIKEDIRAHQGHAALFSMMKQVKCLVVIDDIWTPKDWGQLKAAFPRKAGTRSRLILTSRRDDILSDLDSDQVHLHLVNSLDVVDSWKLFEKITFSGATCTDSKKVKLGREMLKHCKGVPLAIGVLAKLVKTKEDVEEWQQISNDIYAQIGRGGPTKLHKEVYDVLQVSYDDLPFHLKQCFLDFAFLAEDVKIEVSSLYAVWMAQGIVLQDGTNELEEDIVERYLKDLASRNMVQLEYFNDRGTIISGCGIHDLMRDFCIEIARREGFFKQVNCHPSMFENVNHLLMTSPPQIDKRLRHLAIHVSQHQEGQTSTFRTTASSSASTSATISRAPNLRSLFIYHPEDEKGMEKDCTRLIETISQDYPLLRFLGCQFLPIKGKLPKKVGDLIHLRILGFWYTRISEVPSSIEKLQLLQTLALRNVDGVVVSLPNILWKLKQLRHLYLPEVKLGDIPARDKPGYLVKGGGELRLDGLCNLQTLMSIDLDRVSVEGLSKLDRLRLVEAMCETKREALSPFLNNTSLKELQLRLGCQVINEEPMILSTCEALQVLVLHGREGSLVNLNKPLSLEMLPKSLLSLHLKYLKLDADPLPVLEQLHNLETLQLEYCDGLSVMACSAGGFPQLISLVFTRLPEFYSWEVEEGALPKLKKLWIYYCPLKEAPDAIPSSVTVFIE